MNNIPEFVFFLKTVLSGTVLRNKDSSGTLVDQSLYLLVGGLT